MSRSLLTKLAGGSKLEVLKFGLYVFTPIAIMYYTGVPEFLEREVMPLRTKLFRLDQETYHPPAQSDDIKQYMELLRTRKDRILGGSGAGARTDEKPSSS
ncbi:hypothetical protein BCR44DRAFT_38580, partial [Catenaria anguillulae PL171]